MPPPKTQVLVVCHQCQQPFSQFLCRVKVTQYHYCSWDCRAQYLRNPKPLADLLQMFEAKVIHMPEGCWDWVGGMDTHGYGCFSENGTSIRAHQWIYKTIFGPIPKGYDIDHLCRNRACVNPSHLEAVTQIENVRRSDAGHHNNHHNQFVSHCPAGHPYDEQNTHYSRFRNGIPHGRHCRACHRIQEYNRRHRKEAV